MEVVILLIVLVVVGFLINTLGNLKAGPPPLPILNQSESTLQLHAVKVRKAIQGVELDILEFRTTGMFSRSRDIRIPEMIVTMHVNVDGKKHPVLCINENWQAESNIEFESRLKVDTPFNKGVGSIEPVTMGGVPLDALVFPKAGQCIIELTLEVRDLASGQGILRQRTTINHIASGHGYLESMKAETQLQGHMIKLALYMASVDGHTHDKEVKVIQRWGKRVADALPMAQRADRTTHLNESLKVATELIRSGSQSALEKEACAALRNGGDNSDLYVAYELCLNVIKADGEAHPEEMGLLSNIAKNLGLNEEKARAMLDKKVAKLTFTYSDNSDSQDKHLGITAGMSKDEIRKHLSKLFRKHNSRRSSDDSDVRAKAKEWLDMIAEARARHV